jgi:DNA polymerase
VLGSCTRSRTRAKSACKRWLLGEIDILKPRLVVALGSTGVQSLAGRPEPIGRNRGATMTLANGLRVFMTVHPSSVLRVPDEAEKQVSYARFVQDLRAVGELAVESERPDAP